ncbi:MAG: hypothetical protein SGILL_001515, partial [Bacillariaceae sp.]
SSKTPGRSRRRKVIKATPAKAAPTTNIIDKENEEVRVSSGISRRSDSKKNNKEKSHGNNDSNSASILDDDDENVENISLDVRSHHVAARPGNKNNNNNNNSSNTSDSKEVHKEAAHKFQKTLQRVTVSPSTSLFEENEQLAENLVRASLSKQSEANNGGAFLLLDEHHSGLLSFARKLIKEAADTSKKHSLSTQVGNLFVAMHMLRGVAFCLLGNLSVEKTESLLKLFYHLITTAADCSVSSSTGKSDMLITEDDKNPRIDAGFIAISGYEGLGVARNNNQYPFD